MASMIRAVIFAALTAVGANVFGQAAWPQDAKEWKSKGSVVAATSQGVLMQNEQKEPWNVARSPDAKVTVVGSAEASFLQTKLPVRFTGEVTDAKKGTLKDDIAEIEIFTPSGKGSNAFSEPGDESGKPVRKLETGKPYDIKGMVVSFKDGMLTVSSGGKKFIGKVPDTAKIAVNVSDLAFASEGDTISCVGYYKESEKPDTGKSQAGRATASEIEIKLAKPLSAAPKKAKPAKGVREPKSKAPAEAPTSDLFGAGK